MEIRYIKRKYLYGDYEFYIYEPVKLDIKEEKYDTKGEATQIRYMVDGEIKTFTPNRYYSIVKTFTPTPKRILLSEYKKNPVYVPCAERPMPYKGIDRRHLKCEVLPEKRGSYTMLKCLCCGEESPIALNSWEIWNEGESFDFDCKPKEELK